MRDKKWFGLLDRIGKLDDEYKKTVSDPVKQAVIFPSDELSRIRIENKIMRDALKKIAAKELFPDKCVQLYEYQSCKSIAEEAIEEIEGD